MKLAKERIDWAGERIKEFIEAADNFLGGEPYTAFPNEQPEGPTTTRIIYKLSVREQPDNFLRFRVGDAIHNLRSTVDNLVCAIGRISRVGDKLALEFPPAGTKLDTYMKTVSKLPLEIKDWITNEQLPNRTNGPSKLHLLTRLWNSDKHMAPPFMASAIPKQGFSFRFNTPGNKTCVLYRPPGVHAGPRALEDGDEICHYVIETKEIVNFHPDFMFDVAFSKTSRAPGINVRTFLGGIRQHIIREVLPKFEPFLV